MKPNSLANDSEKKQPISPISPRTDFLQPKPPPAVALHDNRPAHLGTTRHRISFKATQPLGPPPNPPQLHGLDLENSHILPGTQMSSASSTTVQSFPSESKIAFVGSASCRRKHGALAEHLGAAPTPLIPAPPAGQRSSSRGQLVGRRLALHQTGNLLSAT